MNANFDWINRTYGLNAAKGGRVEYTGDREPRRGTIMGEGGGHLLIRLDGERHAAPYHPTWELRLLEVGEG